MKLNYICLLALAYFFHVPCVTHGSNTWFRVFSYCQQTNWRFDDSGIPTTKSYPLASAATAVFPLDPDAEVARTASNGDGEAMQAFLSWLNLERSVPGDCALVVGTDENGVYVVSEHEVESRCLKRFDMDTRQIRALTPTNRFEGREFVGPVFLPDGNGREHLSAFVWRSPHGMMTDWRNSEMSEAYRLLMNELKASGIDFLCRAPSNANRWIALARFRSKPPLWLSIDVMSKTWALLAQYPDTISNTERSVFSYQASDGVGLCGVFTRPKGEGPFPLVVFPHGGPGAMSTTDFDERVWALCDAGFAVFQPNYRGSAGFGKQFRFSGWGAEGIKRAMLDIKEGVDAIRCRRDCGIANNRPVLLGGSWGGYCALEQLAMFPGYYGGAVSFFGAFDLPALLQDEIRKAAGLAVCEAEIERRSLIRQFGDPDNAEDMAALASISPLNRVNCISEPVALFHNREDTVIAFSQSERLFSAMTNKAMRVDFHAGDGGHGFLPSEEATIYATIVDKLRQWGENDSGGR